MADTDHFVFLLVTAKTCGYCKIFMDTTWGELKSKLEDFKNIKIKKITLETTNTQPSKNLYHPDLHKFIGWFPTLILVSQKTWNNHSKELKGVVYNGEFTEFKIPNTNTQIKKIKYLGDGTFKTKSILSWVEKSFKSEIFRRNRNKLHTSTDSQQHSSTNRHILITDGNKIIGRTNKQSKPTFEFKDDDSYFKPSIVNEDPHYYV